MLGTGWLKVLQFFLWIAPHMLLAAVAAVIWKRRLYREFPCFFAFALYELAEFVLLFSLPFAHSVTREQYDSIFSATLLLSIALRLGVIDEVAKDLFRASEFLKISARRLLRGVAVILVGIGFLLAICAPGGSGARWHAGVFVVNRAAAIVQCGLLLSLLLFSRFMGLSWRRPAFGIALGLGILTSVDLAASALRAEFTSEVVRQYLNLLITGASFVCVSLWLRYLLVPEAEPASPVIGPSDEVETWNTEFRHLLRQ